MGRNAFLIWFYWWKCIGILIYSFNLSYFWKQETSKHDKHFFVNIINYVDIFIW